MKITGIRPFLVDCFRTNWAFVLVETDEGVSGVGEATLEYKEQALLGALSHLDDALVGKNPLNIEAIYHDAYRDAYWRGGAVLMSALSAVEMALWDILGKTLDRPVWQLLGGKVREDVRIYVNGWFAGARTPEAFAEKARQAVARGMTALKWDPFGSAYRTLTSRELDAAIACVDAVRRAVGTEADLLIEGHGRFDVPTAIQIAREIAPFRPMFFEEPVPPDNLDALAQVRAASPVPIAAGERLYTRQGFRELLERRAADFIQPDVSHAGGIGECRKIAAMAESYYLPFAPHNPSGPVANAATLQLAACTPNFSILEIMYDDVIWRQDVTDEALVCREGRIVIPQKPGLGLTLHEAACLEHPYSPHTLRHYTGALTDIRPPEKAFYF